MDDAEDAVRVWLVEREIDDRDLVSLTYATPDGERVFERTLALAVLDDGAKAARDVEADELDATPADKTDRYAAEAERVAAEHDPEDRL